MSTERCVNGIVMVLQTEDKGGRSSHGSRRVCSLTLWEWKCSWNSYDKHSAGVIGSSKLSSSWPRRKVSAEVRTKGSTMKLEQRAFRISRVWFTVWYINYWNSSGRRGGGYRVEHQGSSLPHLLLIQSRAAVGVSCGSAIERAHLTLYLDAKQLGARVTSLGPIWSSESKLLTKRNSRHQAIRWPIIFLGKNWP